MATEKEIKDEKEKLQELRFMFDLTLALLKKADLSVLEMLRLVMNTRIFALRLFPGSEDNYDLFFSAKFHRIIERKLPKN